MDTGLTQGPVLDGGPSVTLTIRLIMQGKEVGSIIGKKGDNIKKFREESGAKINISDGSCPERIVTVTGPTDGILKAFSLISAKFEEDTIVPPLPPIGMPAAAMAASVKPLVTLRLVVPASQCGSLIGKGGAKIKEIREITGATIQVASEMLPNSTERAVTISGTADGITKICCVMMESPPKGATIPYRPKPAMPPVIFAGGQAYTIQGQYAIPHPDLTKLHQLALQHAPLAPGQNQSPAAAAAAAAAAAYGLPALAPPPPPPPATHHRQAPAIPGQQVPGTQSSSSQEMSIPNELIGCIIGKGGAKINEIRQLSGATIKISNTEEGSKDRTVVIAGTPESVNLAQYLINTSMELHKNLTLDPNLQLHHQNPMTASAVSPVVSSSCTSSSAAAAAQASLVPKPVSAAAAAPPAPHPSASSHPSLSSLAAAAAAASASQLLQHHHHLHQSLFSADCAFAPSMRMKPLVTKVRSALAPAAPVAAVAENGNGGNGSLLSQAIGAHKQGVAGKAERKFAPY